jgi:hypothetical protein
MAATACVATAMVSLLNAAIVVASGTGASAGPGAFFIAAGTFLVAGLALLFAGRRMGRRAGYWPLPRGARIALPLAYLLGILLPVLQIATGRSTWPWAVGSSVIVLVAAGMMGLILGH